MLTRLAVTTFVAASLLASRDASAQSPQPSPSDATQATEMVSVRIESPEPVDLEAKEDGRWHVVCSSPCGRPLSPKLLYRINGKSVKVSEEFHLEQGKTIAIAVEPGSKANRGGVVLVIVGLVALGPAIVVTVLEAVSLFGGLILICPFVAAFSSKNQQNSAYGQCLGDIATTIGKYYAEPYVWIPAITGGALMIVGGIWAAASRGTPTTITQRAARRTDVPGDPAAWRKPEWQMPEPPHTRVYATAPIVELSF